MRRQAGVTLLEVLVAVTMLSLLSVGMFLAMRVGLSAFARTNTRLMENRRVAGSQRVLEQELENLLPALAGCGAAANVPGGRTPMFQGGPDTLTMVSAFSLQEASRGRPQVLQFLVAPSDNGGLRLLVNEIPYGGALSMGSMCIGTTPVPETGAEIAQFPRPSQGPNSFVLADRLAYCRFKYLTPSPKPGEPGAWLPSWTGKGWPSGIRIEMAPSEPSAAQLQPVTVTAPVYLTRNPEVQYADR